MYTDIMKGGLLEYIMDKTPNKAFGALKADWPISNP
jgi:hypothetical protein